MVTVLQKLTINGSRLKQDFDELAAIGATAYGGISRLALSNEDLEARAWFANRVEAAGLLVRDDEVGNLSGVLLSDNPDAPTFLIGSHLDTVPEGGAYDGSVGILAGLECLRTLKEHDVKLPYHLEVINFTDEEGTWHSFFGSLGLVGGLSSVFKDDDHQSKAAFRVALFRAGIRPDEVDLAYRDPAQVAGYLELHIEQSGSLDTTGKQIGIVSQIVGRSTYNIVFYGEAMHAATTPREKQRDALRGAAEFITAMHRLAREEYPGGIFNCGNVRVQPGAYSVVPAEAALHVELRHHEESTLSAMDSRVIRLAQEIAREYRLSVRAEQTLRRPVAYMNDRMQGVIAEVCKAQERSAMPIISYAGHDAQILSATIPSAMIFIPSTDGISHSPKEYTNWDDIEAGANVLLHTLVRLLSP